VIKQDKYLALQTFYLIGNN